MVRRQRLAASLLVGLIALVAASFTLLPGVAFWDTGELQSVAPLMGTAHPTGFPTYVLIGWLLGAEALSIYVIAFRLASAVPAFLEENGDQRELAAREARRSGVIPLTLRPAAV